MVDWVDVTAWRYGEVTFWSTSDVFSSPSVSTELLLPSISWSPILFCVGEVSGADVLGCCIRLVFVGIMVTVRLEKKGFLFTLPNQLLSVTSWMGISGLTNFLQINRIILLYSFYNPIKRLRKSIYVCQTMWAKEDPQRVKSDGVIGHILKRENRIGWQKLRFCVTDQSGIQRDLVNLRKHEFQEITRRDLCKKPAWKRDFEPP